ncbi:MAG: hypothetical protein LC800_18485, partial [Acidobacteria bacterium]|nr:hypothetical protein [Acidobacteriota bacterium]
AYTFQNNSGSPICVTVTLATSTADAGRLQSGAFAPTYDPARPSDNYLGDIAGNGPDSRSYSFTVPANTSFVVVVNEVIQNGGIGAAYTLTVDGLPAATAVPRLVSLQFAAANQSVQEDCTAVNLQVKRTGDTSLPVTVDYATANGTAQGRTDYTDAVGTLTFPAGQDTANITVLISEDSFVEGPETFTVTLTNARGVEVGLGATQVTTVEITDDAAEPATNAIDDPSTFVRQHYHDFLGREADAGGLNAWVTLLTNCAPGNTNCDRVAVSSAFFRSPEYAQKGYYAIRFYMAALGRDPSYQEFIRDLSRLNGATPAETEAARAAFAAEFLSRAEVRAVYDPLSNFGFVNKVAETAGVTLANRDQLVNDLDAGVKTRAQVLREIIESQQVANRFFNRGFVLSEYFGYLRRDPDAGGFNAWLNYLNANPTDFRTMVNGFINSQEYRSRFGQP